nr:PREDICTED: leucine-rich repeat-containing protein 26 [Latimeria chalumnae]|eukprot:XP_014347166.1 PREDICTED: leucine-rich repeat-containing protein 26 [Latimeria chalumnae]
MDNSGKSAVFFFLFLLRCLLSSCCPLVCKCDLQTVDCNNKALRAVPRNLSPNTSRILLAENIITVLNSNSFLNQQLLQELNLRNNLIFYIHSMAFKSLTNLTTLDLSGNQLTFISAETFSFLLALHTLNLGNNKIKSIEKGALEKSVTLETLFLHNNSLNCLTVSILEALPSLHSVRLDGNPWECTCQLQQLHSWINDNAKKIQELHMIECDSPANLNQFPVVALEMESFNRCCEVLNTFDYVFFFTIGPGKLNNGVSSEKYNKFLIKSAGLILVKYGDVYNIMYAIFNELKSFQAFFLYSLNSLVVVE